MKKSIILSIAILSLLACSKSDNVSPPETKYGTVIFYTLNPSQHNMWRVLVDGVDRGLDPYTIIVPSCENNPGILGLFVKLTVGKHEVKFVSLAGYAPWTKEITVNEGCQQFN